jgi:hypothetical protein
MATGLCNRQPLAFIGRALKAALARGVAFVLLEIKLCGVGIACGSRLTFHPVE